MEPPERAPMRAADSDRERTLELLKERAADGSLTLDEFAARVDSALIARTQLDLDEIVADLRAPATTSTTRRPKKLRRWVVSIMGGAQTRGRWRCGSQVHALTIMGGCQIDLRGAEILADEVHITAVAIMGGIEITVPEGIGVTMDGLPIMGGRGMRVKDVPLLPGSPHVYVHAFPIMGGVQVKSGRRHGARPSVEPPAPPAVSAPSSAAASADRRTAIDALPTAGTVTVMFADLCDYSGIHERLGDTEARRVAGDYARIVREQLHDHDGVEIKCNGDGFMVAFRSAVSAVQCALNLQHALENDPDAKSEALQAHVGIHAGEVVRENDDLHGATVILASRLAEAAAPGEVVVSALTRELCRGTRELTFDGPRQVPLKGVGEREVFSARTA